MFYVCLLMTHSDNERGYRLSPLHGLLIPISSKVLLLFLILVLAVLILVLAEIDQWVNHEGIDPLYLRSISERSTFELRSASI